jgi:large subunit ribosomal protein L30
MAKLKVTLTQSLAGQIKQNRNIVKTMGFRKIGQVKVFPKNKAMEGMVKKVAYMLKVEEEA